MSVPRGSLLSRCHLLPLFFGQVLQQRLVLVLQGIEASLAVQLRRQLEALGEQVAHVAIELVELIPTL